MASDILHLGDLIARAVAAAMTPLDAQLKKKIANRDHRDERPGRHQWPRWNGRHLSCRFPDVTCLLYSCPCKHSEILSRAWAVGCLCLCSLLSLSFSVNSFLRATKRPLFKTGTEHNCDAVDKREGLAEEYSSMARIRSQGQTRGYRTGTERRQNSPRCNAHGLVPPQKFRNGQEVPNIHCVHRAITAAKVLDVISSLPGCAGRASDAVSTYAQVKKEDVPKVLGSLASECPTVYHDPAAQKHRTKSKTPWYRMKENCTDAHWQDCCGNDNLKRS